jgi:hypothetical protein
MSTVVEIESALSCILLVSLALAANTSLAAGAAKSLAVKATNPLPEARASQTIELSAKDLAPLGQNDFAKIHVRDDAGKEVLCQAVDTDFDAYHRPDIVIFQADFAPGQTRAFTVSSGARQVYAKDQFKAHGRFVRERFDDFAWENDRVAHRMYGKAVETWAGEALTSSAVDIWSKRVPGMVIDEWYMVDNYHVDVGQGADFYTAGTTRGCGGNGLWAADKLWVSKNFVNSRVLANGPIRILFELVYEAFDVSGTPVAETKRITLDAGQNLSHCLSTYQTQGAVGPLTCAIGLKNVAGESKQFDAEHGWLAIWENMEKKQGMQGLALIVNPKDLLKETSDAANNLLLVKASPANTVSYWTGFAWDKAGQIANEDAWKAYVAQFTRGLLSPIVVTVSGE